MEKQNTAQVLGTNSASLTLDGSTMQPGEDVECTVAFTDSFGDSVLQVRHARLKIGSHSLLL